MFRDNKLIVFFVFASLLVFPPVVYAKVGTFNQVLGKVEQLKDGKQPAITPKITDAVARLDVINTKAQSRAEIILLDNSVLTVAPESHVIVEQYLYEDKNKRNIVINLVSGFLDVVVTKAAPQGEMLIKTSTAIMGIRGSWAKAGVKGDNALFAMVAGTGIIKKSAPSKKAQLDSLGKVAYTVKSSGPPASDVITIGAEEHGFAQERLSDIQLAQLEGGPGGSVVLNSFQATTMVDGVVAPPQTMTVGQMQALIAATNSFVANNFTITRNVGNSINSASDPKATLPPAAAAKAVQAKEAALITGGTEAKVLATMAKDAVLTPDQVKAIISSVLKEGTDVVKASGADSKTAVTAVTQAATQGAIQGGATVQQAVSTITTAAVQTASSLGLNAQTALVAVTQGATAGAIQSGVTLQQAVNTVTTVAVQTATTLGVTTTSAITAVTQGATQGAVQSGVTTQQAISTVTTVATQTAINSGMSATDAAAAVSAGTQAAAPTAPAPTTAPAPPPPPPSVPTGTNTVSGSAGGGGAGGGGTASPSQ